MLDRMQDHQKLINVSMIVAVIVVVGRTILLAVPEVVPFGSEVGELLYDAGLAFATAWLFQWLVIVRPERARRLVANQILVPRVDDLVRPGRQFLMMLRNSTGRDGPGWPPQKHEFMEMCSQVKTLHPPHGFLAPSWWPYLQYIQRRREEAHRALEAYYDRMELDLLRLVAAEGDKGKMLRVFEPGWPPPTNSNLAAFAENLWMWLEALEVIRTYRDTVISPDTQTPEEPY